MKKKSFIGSAITLMIAGLIVRVLGFVYRVYLSNLIGAEGMGLFQLISPVYSLIILTLTSGMSIAVSRMVAAQTAKNNNINSRRITICALLITCAAGTIISLFLLMNINFVINQIMKDTRTYYSFLLILPNIPIIAASSALKGYFYGMQDVTPTAVSQVVEQVVRISLVMIISSRYIGLGIEYACALATIGMVLGEISNLLVLIIVYNLRKKDEYKLRTQRNLMRKRVIVSQLLKISVPISMNRFITSMMSTVEYIMIPRMLLMGGIDYKASMEQYGRLTGMAMPLIFFPSLVTSSIATTLIPAIAEAVSKKNMRSINYRINQSLQITFVLGFLFSSIFMAYSNEIGNLFYARENIGSLLYTLSFTCIFIYLQQTMTGILNGLGKQAVSLRNGIIGNAIRICLIYFLMPAYGIESYIWSIIASYLVVVLMNFYVVVKTTSLIFNIRNWILKPGLIGIILLMTSKYVKSFYEIFLLNTKITVLLSLGTTIFVGIFLMITAGVISRGEIKKIIGLK
ncbi:MAG TPA: stage V sporulation protein B [Clostridiaceae bacterium]|nr:stage V sporulation protein B [Clostridiaceae bacterium]